MKKFFKKPIAIVLAMLIVLGSVVAGVYALTADDTGKFTVYTRLYRSDSENGPWEPVDYGEKNNNCKGVLSVKKGDYIQARVDCESELVESAQGDTTDFKVYQLAMLWSYNKNVLELDSAQDPTKQKAGVAYFDSKYGQVQVLPGQDIASDIDEIKNDSNYGDKSFFYTGMFNGMCDPDGNQYPEGVELKLNDNTGREIFVFNFVVKDDAPINQEALVTVEEASVATMQGTPDSPDYSKADTIVYATYVSSFPFLDRQN